MANAVTPYQLTLDVTKVSIEDYDFGPRFDTERDMCNMLEWNIDKFVAEIAHEEVESYKREAYLSFKRFGSGAPRIDFMVHTKTGKTLLIECKNPNQPHSEMSRAVSQLLAYSTVRANHHPTDDQRLYLVTSATTPLIQQMILRYELPIDVVILTKKSLAQWSPGDE